MAIELVVIKTEDNGITSDMVNRLELSDFDLNVAIRIIPEVLQKSNEGN